MPDAAGEVDAGNEVMGFTRGLFAAGAKCLIVTSWLVDDRKPCSFRMRSFNAWREPTILETPIQSPQPSCEVTTAILITGGKVRSDVA
ncbi:CHAT domain-containing protein [Paraburkholderia sp. Cpub6]|uniref:CHAT domain-containing protein n=1 Tax=Paraburkholderia sp. Cpub6 TaxID=2723094 RepID=UPI00161DBAE2